MINNLDISIFDKRFKQIRPAKLLLDMLVYLYCLKDSPFKYAENTLKISELNLIEAMSEVGVNELTKSQLQSKERRLRWWRTRLELEGAIKYKQSNVSLYMINPLYYFNGTDAEFKKAKNRWNSFDCKHTPYYFNEI